MDGLPFLSDAGPGALIALAVVLVLTGRLVPWWLVKAKDERIEKLEEANRELLEALSGIREPIETNNALLRAITDPLERRR